MGAESCFEVASTLAYWIADRTSVNFFRAIMESELADVPLKIIQQKTLVALAAGVVSFFLYYADELDVYKWIHSSHPSLLKYGEDIIDGALIDQLFLSDYDLHPLFDLCFIAKPFEQLCEEFAVNISLTLGDIRVLALDGAQYPRGLPHLWIYPRHLLELDIAFR